MSDWLEVLKLAGPTTTVALFALWLGYRQSRDVAVQIGTALRANTAAVLKLAAAKVAKGEE